MQKNIMRDRWIETSFLSKVIHIDNLMFVFNIKHHMDISEWLKERFSNRPFDYYLSVENKPGTIFKLYDILEFKNKSDAIEFKLRFI